MGFYVIYWITAVNLCDVFINVQNDLCINVCIQLTHSEAKWHIYQGWPSTQPSSRPAHNPAAHHRAAHSLGCVRLGGVLQGCVQGG